MVLQRWIRTPPTRKSACTPATKVVAFLLGHLEMEKELRTDNAFAKNRVAWEVVSPYHFEAENLYDCV